MLSSSSEEEFEGEERAGVRQLHWLRSKTQAVQQQAVLVLDQQAGLAAEAQRHLERTSKARRMTEVRGRGG